MPSWKKVITSGSDVAFKGITSTTAITASAISASGAILGKQVDVKFHAYNDSGTGENFIPAVGTREATVVGGSAYYTEWIAPYDGQIEKVIVTTSTSAGSTAVKFRINGSIKATQTLTVNANTPTTFSTLNNHPSTTADRTFSAGDILQISIDPSTTGTNIQVTSVWVYNIDNLTL